MSRDSDARGDEAAGAKDDTEQRSIGPALAAAGPSRDTQSAALLASIAQRVETSERRVADLAREFMALGVPDPWRAHFDAWAVERRLPPELRQAVVVRLLRERVFGYIRRAEARPHGRRRARR